MQRTFNRHRFTTEWYSTVMMSAMKTSSHKALLQRTNINCHSNLSTIRALVRLTSNPLELNILYTGAEEAADKLFYKTVGELFDTGILCNFQSWI